MSAQHKLNAVRSAAAWLLAALLLASCGEPTGDDEIDFDGTQRPPVPAEATNASDFDNNDEPTDEARHPAPEQSVMLVTLPRNAR